MFANRVFLQIAKWLCVLVLLFAFQPGATAQVTGVKLQFVLHYAGSPLAFENGICKIPNSSDSVKLTRFRFYVSNLVLMEEGKVVWNDTPAFHLVDLAGDREPVILLAVPERLAYTSIAFNLGIDSATNAAGAAGGDLDPLKGMYWAWHSGYINMKMEGSSPVCKNRKNEFQFHLGGFREKENCEKKLLFAVQPSSEIRVGVDVSKFLEKIDLSTQHTIMTPGPATVKLSEKAAGMFGIITPKR